MERIAERSAGAFVAAGPCGTVPNLPEQEIHSVENLLTVQDHQERPPQNRIFQMLETLFVTKQTVPLMSMHSAMPTLSHQRSPHRSQNNPSLEVRPNLKVCPNNNKNPNPNIPNIGYCSFCNYCFRVSNSSGLDGRRG